MNWIYSSADVCMSDEEYKILLNIFYLFIMYINIIISKIEKYHKLDAKQRLVVIAQCFSKGVYRELN